jgi:hypothetical protein
MANQSRHCSYGNTYQLDFVRGLLYIASNNKKYASAQIVVINLTYGGVDMRYPVNLINAIKKIPIILIFFLTVGNGTANATIINFDDIYYDPEYPEFYGNPVSDQYVSKGLLIDGGYLQQYWSDSEGIISSPNYLLAGNHMRMTFLGESPTFVSLYVNSWRQEAIFFDVYGDSGLIMSKKTKGFSWPDDGIPYEPNQFMSFASEEGIRSINVYGFYNRSTAGEIDDLTFTYGVPEPSLLILLGLGLLMLNVNRARIAR